MRYDKNNVAEMSGRLTYLVECFSAASQRGDSSAYVGPKVDDARQIRPQDFLPLDIVPTTALEPLVRNLLNAATAQGKMTEVTPVVVAAAKVVSTFPPEYQDIPSMKGLING
ncbi:MAG: hypothetical protein PHX61_09575 [Alphaproteobacteria bacterium]|nr:hypothetical protein [Alphaproteobacteria bacterium]